MFLTFTCGLLLMGVILIFKLFALFLPKITPYTNQQDDWWNHTQDNPQPCQIGFCDLWCDLVLFHTFTYFQWSTAFLLAKRFCGELILYWSAFASHSDWTVIIWFVTAVNWVLRVAVSVTDFARVDRIGWLNCSAYRCAVWKRYLNQE